MLISSIVDETADRLVASALQAKAEGQFTVARDSLLRAVVMLRQQSSPLALGSALRELGEAERAIHGPDAGAAAYEEAVEILRQANAPLRLAHTVRHLGDIYRHAHGYDRARQCYDEALSLYRDSPDSRPLDVANALRGAALLHEKMGEFRQAQQLWEEARALYREVNVDVAVQEASQHLTPVATTWHIYDLAMEKPPEGSAKDIYSIFLNGFGLTEKNAWRIERIADALRRISFLALAYANDEPNACGYAMYTVPPIPFDDGTYLLWEDAICLRKTAQGQGGRSDLFAKITARSHHRPIGWIGGRTQNPRVIKTYCRLGHSFPFSENYETPDGQAIMAFLRAHVDEVRHVEKLDLPCGIGRHVYRQGRLGDYDEDAYKTLEFERQLADWKFDRDNGDAVIVTARLRTPW